MPNNKKDLTRSPRPFSLKSLLGRLNPAARGERTLNLSGPERLPLDPASQASFNPQVARRMAQLEAELTRLAENQFAAREERSRLSEEVTRLREAAARQEIAPPPAPRRGEKLPALTDENIPNSAPAETTPAGGGPAR